jgi:hypothetical protein
MLMYDHSFNPFSQLSKFIQLLASSVVNSHQLMAYIQTGYLMPDKFIGNIALHFTEGNQVPETFHLNNVPRQDKHQLWARAMLAEKMLRQAFPESRFDHYVKKRDVGGEPAVLLQFRKVDIDDSEGSDEYEKLQSGFHPQMEESDDSRKVRDWVLDHFWELKDESKDSFEWYYEYDLDGSGIKTGPEETSE